MFDWFLFSVEFLISHFSLTKSYNIDLNFMLLFHVFLKLISVFNNATIKVIPKYWKLWKNFIELSIFIFSKNLIKHSFCTSNTCFNKFRLNFFISILFSSSFLLCINLSGSFTMLLEGNFLHIFINKSIIKILKVLKHLNGIVLIILFTRALILPWVISHLQHFKFVFQLSKVHNNSFMRSKEVFTNW